MLNSYQAKVESLHPRDSIAWLKLQRGRLAGRLWPGLRKGQTVSIHIDPGDITLFAEHPGRTSARNVLPGHVTAVQYIPEGAYVTIHAGFSLTSLVSRKSVVELGLRKGSPVFAVFKVMAIRPELPTRARIRACLVGKNGLLLPKQIDFLRALRRTGSLSAAARELQMQYRSAWSWATIINRAWGRPLVQSSKGGKGGGGAALTPECLVALDLAARIEKNQ